MNEVIAHYDALIDENNDPVHDPLPLKVYMDKWDGQPFIDCLQPLDGKDILEVGVGTGRLAVRICDMCGSFTGIDISAKTIERATKNIRGLSYVSLVCGDFLEYTFGGKFDVIYSSLTFIHIEDKKSAFDKVASLLKPHGRFVLSMDKSQDEILDFGTRQIRLYPATDAQIHELVMSSGLTITNQFETEFANIFIAVNQTKEKFYETD